MNTFKLCIGIVLLVIQSTWILAQSHPMLMITADEVAIIRSNLDTAPLFARTFEAVLKEVDAEIELGVLVPIPKDMAGGYTHERHKRNFLILEKAGYVFQITKEEKYAEYIRDNFMAYAKMFPQLPKHPTDRSYATGKIFWQCLNDANWLVYCSQAYDCIYDWLQEDERKFMEDNLFRPLADYISVDNPQFFNRVHNHSTWGNAAVGMIGLVMGDDDLVHRALYGISNDGISADMVDNDGGYIKKKGERQAGFFAQMDYSFSPDGHFTEGPYYLRYAMSPFLLFSKALSNCRPDLDIYSYRDSILNKAVYSLLYETDAQGQFFPINDAQKGMSWLSRDVIGTIDIAYADLGLDPMLLSIAEKQGKVQIDYTGFIVARDIEKDLAVPFQHKSISYTDGADGTKGGLTIVRAAAGKDDELCLLFKYAAQGMGHGHFDRLAYSLYNSRGEIIQDYASARWVNIDQKGGGRYLPENRTFAKQSIAHNTIVVNEKSQYKGDVKTGELHDPKLSFHSLGDEQLQVVSAKDVHAYANTELHRTLFMIKDENLDRPILVDFFKITSDRPQQYDLPLWFQGHLLETDFSYQKNVDQLSILGNRDGYQHIWNEATAIADSSCSKITWMNNGRIFTMTSVTEVNDQLIFGRAGANDPYYNLRNDPVFIQRKLNKKDVLFASVLESHGSYDPVSETANSPYGSILNMKILRHDNTYTIARILLENDLEMIACISNSDVETTKSHLVKMDEKDLHWTGPYAVIRN